jgi:hypothetical protein
MADEPTLIVQVPLGSAIERQLRDEPPPPFRTDEVLVQTGPTDDQGTLEELAGEAVVLAAARNAPRPVILRVIRPSER